MGNGRGKKSERRDREGGCKEEAEERRRGGEREAGTPRDTEPSLPAAAAAPTVFHEGLSQKISATGPPS